MAGNVHGFWPEREKRNIYRRSTSGYLHRSVTLSGSPKGKMVSAGLSRQALLKPYRAAWQAWLDSSRDVSWLSDTKTGVLAAD